MTQYQYKIVFTQDLAGVSAPRSFADRRSFYEPDESTELTGGEHRIEWYNITSTWKRA